jgi:Ca2+-binding EF-hand superfamily protein
MNKTVIFAAGLCVLGLAAPPAGLASKADGKKAKIIAKYDKNGNGIIDGDEKEAIRKDYAANPNGELKAFDTNGDGKLDDDEIAAIKPGAGSKDKTKIQQVLAKYDTNKNGMIDGAEKEALRKDYAANKDGDLKAFDKNKDGKLDDQEIAAITMAKKEKGKSKGEGKGSKTADAALAPEKK